MSDEKGLAPAFTVRLAEDLYSAVVPIAGGAIVESRSYLEGAWYPEGLEGCYTGGPHGTSKIL